MNGVLLAGEPACHSDANGIKPVGNQNWLINMLSIHQDRHEITVYYTPELSARQNFSKEFGQIGKIIAQITTHYAEIF